jgi:hydroxyacylglutathione hydrolase
MILQRFEVPGLAHYSYLIASEQQAIVIDPQRDISVYREFAAAKGLSITHILETHIHADYASGSLALAAITGAKLCLSAHDHGQHYRYKMPHLELKDGDEVSFGKLRIVALHTPGHTPEHLSFLLFDQQGCGDPLGIFSGDFLLIGSLGRPDLLGEGEKQRLAEQLFDSSQHRIADLPDGTIVYPGHGAGSLCGVGISERPESTIGYERHCNVFMASSSREAFVAKILGSVPQFPGYYRKMKALNAQGAPPFSTVPGAVAHNPWSFEAESRKEGGIILDVRTPDAFGGAHIPGAFNIGAGSNLSLWAGWVLPYEGNIFIVGDDSSESLEDARKSLLRVGHDRIAGYLKGGMNAWLAAGLDQAHLPQLSVRELHAVVAEGATVLDVRSPGEWKIGHIASAIHIPLGDLSERLQELPVAVPLHVICGSGYRSSIGCSILQRAGFPQVRNTAGGMTAWYAQGLPTSTK